MQPNVPRSTARNVSHTNRAARMGLITAAVVFMGLAVAHRQLAASHPTPEDHTGQTPVLLQLRKDVEVNSFIVRVGDVVAPIGEPPKGWLELSGKAIALLPSDGRRMRMERQRIAECLERTGLLSAPAQWSGPESASVAYVRHSVPVEYPTTSMPQSTPTPRKETSLQQAGGRQFPSTSSSMSTSSYGTDSNGPKSNEANSPTSVRTISYNQPAFPNLFPAERNRIERMILSAFPKTHAEVLEKFEVAISPEDQGINGLKDLRAVRSLRLSESPKEGRSQLWVAGETEYKEIEAVVDIDLIELPIVVFTTTSLQRGDILTERDLIAKPIPRQQYDSRYVSDIELLLNKEMVRTISTDRPLKLQDISEPIVIKRGDTVELRVVGAGVTVVTRAKALAPAAAGESIMVETELPKQKMTARVVKSGVVEIITRPPSTM